MADFKLRQPGAGQGVTSETLQRLATIWSDILGTSDLSADHNFKELGGDSAASVQCLNRIYEAYGCRVALATFFERDMTLGKLAAIVDEMVGDSGR